LTKELASRKQGEVDAHRIDPSRGKEGKDQERTGQETCYTQQLEKQKNYAEIQKLLHDRYV